jgi:hypothetical protein
MLGLQRRLEDHSVDELQNTQHKHDENRLPYELLEKIPTLFPQFKEPELPGRSGGLRFCCNATRFL